MFANKKTPLRRGRKNIIANSRVAVYLANIILNSMSSLDSSHKRIEKIICLLNIILLVTYSVGPTYLFPLGKTTP